ncbi:hypothetical protein [Burkholderia ubonensis]|uniref:hypothetical protein n=1 Tax=Burkholderia ubonensis TaxID=101571 RepID=UPI000757DDA0|nr:hypothetical protein [Burkholderia ubonensis]KWC67485.1 hypothetical protein WL53_06115 [Burkholderia ubonensis]
MADLNVALLGFIGVLVGGYFNNFLAEDYRRFRDGQALAGALAGELESHGDAASQIRQNLALLIEHGDVPTAAVKIPEWPIPNSPIFEANAEKIGLLDPDSARDVAYVYEQIRAFRLALNMLSKHQAEFGVDWRTSLAKSCTTAIERAEDRGRPLVERLKRHAKASYWHRPATLKQCAAGLILVAALLVAAMRVSGPTASTNCTTAFDHAQGVLSTVCK